MPSININQSDIRVVAQGNYCYLQGMVWLISEIMKLNGNNGYVFDFENKSFSMFVSSNGVMINVNFFCLVSGSPTYTCVGFKSDVDGWLLVET